MGCCAHSGSQISQRTTACLRFLKKSVMAVCLVPVPMEGPCVERKGAGPLSLCQLGLMAQSAQTRRSFRFGGLL